MTRSCDNLVDRLDDPVHVAQFHGRKQWQRDRFAPDLFGVGKLAFAVTHLTVRCEQVDGWIVYANTNAPLSHRLDKLRPGDLQLRQGQQRREDVPTVSLIPTLRKSYRRVVSPQFVVPRHELAAPRIELLEM